ncbi:MAG: TetR/AcrR family transcriptional regulator [Pseudonocardiaceae bacterium]|nr:TetR/AcrR family transcriptional regulator [Pseudonocardiaceae bacterium]
MFAGVNIGLMESSAGGKRGYHHGDLRNALVTAAAKLAARGGPGSVTIRAAAREVGVTPTAAYRHFAGHVELLTAAKERALDELTEAMHKELAAGSTSGDPVHRALARLGALGRGYIAFARAQPGLFRTVHSPEGPVLAEDRSGTGPFQMLLGALDELVAVGYLSPARRPLAELTAWAMVHGLAALLDGPLREMPDNIRDEAIVNSMLVLGHGLKGAGMTPAQEAQLTNELTPLTA